MQIEFSIILKDYRNAVWLYCKKRPFSMIAYVYALWLMPFLGVACIAFGVYGQVNYPRALGAYFSNVIPFFILCILLPAVQEINLRRKFSSAFPEGSRFITAIFTQDSFLCVLPGRVESRYYWSTLYGFTEDESIALLFITKASFVMIPKRVLSKADLQELRNLINNGKSKY